MARYPYSSYEVEPLAQYRYHDPAFAMQTGSRRFFSAIGRFIYRVLVLALVVGALGGILFALHRNDMLLNLARGAGFEAQYRSLSLRLAGMGLGTPQSLDVPADSQATPAPGAPIGSGEKQPETVNAGARTAGATATAEGLPIVSFDSLPTAPSKGSRTETASLETPAPASRSHVEATVARSEPAPQRAAKSREETKPAEPTRSIPLPKPKPEPVAKAAPAPKPAPKAKPEPEEDHTAPRANDNPLKAAIRASMAAKK